jgi:hypothetical protein
MTTINSAVRGLPFKGKTAVTRMKRASLSIVPKGFWKFLLPCGAYILAVSSVILHGITLSSAWSPHS